MSDNQESISACRTYLRQKLTCHSAPSVGPPIGLETQVDDLKSMIGSILQEKRSEAVLLVGDRGTGKSLCLDLALQDVSRHHRFKLVHLNGLLQDTEALALREVAWQLKAKEEGGGEKGGVKGKRGAQNQLSFLLNSMTHTHIEKLPVVFVLEEMEAFAMGKKQMLLYNLIDLKHDPSVHILILGLTTTVSIMDMFDKRVRSRISQKHIIFTHCPYEKLLKVMDSMVLIPQGQVGIDAGYREEFNRKWAILSRENQMFKSIVLRWHAMGKDLRAWSRLFYSAILYLDEQHPYLTLEDFQKACHSSAVRGIGQVSSLTVLQLLVLICMKRIHNRGIPRFDLETVHKEYAAFLRLSPQTPYKFPRKAIKQAFMDLLSNGLVCCRRSSSYQSYFHTPQPLELSQGVEVEHLQVALAMSPDDLEIVLKEGGDNLLPTAISAWATGPSVDM